MFNSMKVTIAVLFVGILGAVAAGAANAITFTYSEKYSSCDTLTVKTTGEIVCNCSPPGHTNSGGVFICNTGGASAFHFNFVEPLSCTAGLDINTTTGRVACATTLPTCNSLSASPASTVSAGSSVTLTAACSQTTSSYLWTSAPELVPASGTNTATLTIPAETASAGYRSYSVTAVNNDGTGGSASTFVKVVVPGQTGPFAYIPGNGTSGKVSVLDTASNTANSNLFNVGAIPLGVAVHPSGIRAYVTNQGHNNVSVIDTATNGEIATVDVAPAGLSPAGVAITPDGRKVYVANTATDNVSVINALDNKVLRTVSLPTGSRPVGVAVVKKTDGTQQVFVANSAASYVSVIDTVTDELTPIKPVTDLGSYGVAAKPDGSKVYVTNSTSNSVTEIDTGNYGSRGILLPSGAKPQGIAVKPDGAEVYVVNNGNGTVSVININTAENPIATITGLGILPYNVAFNPAGSLAYVTNSGSGNVSIIDTATRSVVDTVTVGGAPYALGQFVGPASTYRGLWWNPNESGWGMSITQHGSMIFVAVYTYDQAGQPIWYVMSSCPVSGNGCSGDIYAVTGGTPPNVNWNDANKVVTKAGTGTLTFTDANHGKFDFNLSGVQSTRTIERQLFSKGTAAQAVDYTDLWWNASESGWGVALTQDMGILFATWYGYDAVGKAIWYVVSDCPVVSTGAVTGCFGDLYQVTGGSPLTAAWNGANKVNNKVGKVLFDFSNANDGVMTFIFNNNTTASKRITRQPFPF